jgi:hypothetical protein
LTLWWRLQKPEKQTLLRSPFKNKFHNLFITFSDMAGKKTISVIFSSYTLFKPQNIISTPLWDPLSKKRIRVLLIFHFSDWLKTKSISSILSIFTLQEPQNIIWTPHPFETPFQKSII